MAKELESIATAAGVAQPGHLANVTLPSSYPLLTLFLYILYPATSPVLLFGLDTSPRAKSFNISVYCTGYDLIFWVSSCGSWGARSTTMPGISCPQFLPDFPFLYHYCHNHNVPLICIQPPAPNESNENKTVTYSVFII